MRARANPRPETNGSAAANGPYSELLPRQVLTALGRRAELAKEGRERIARARHEIEEDIDGVLRNIILAFEGHKSRLFALIDAHSKFFDSRLERLHEGATEITAWAADRLREAESQANLQNSTDEVLFKHLTEARLRRRSADEIERALLDIKQRTEEMRLPELAAEILSFVAPEVPPLYCRSEAAEIHRLLCQDVSQCIVRVALDNATLPLEEEKTTKMSIMRPDSHLPDRHPRASSPARHTQPSSPRRNIDLVQSPQSPSSSRHTFPPSAPPPRHPSSPSLRAPGPHSSFSPLPQAHYAMARQQERDSSAQTQYAIPQKPETGATFQPHYATSRQHEPIAGAQQHYAVPRQQETGVVAQARHAFEDHMDLTSPCVSFERELIISQNVRLTCLTALSATVIVLGTEEGTLISVNADKGSIADNLFLKAHSAPVMVLTYAKDLLLSSAMAPDFSVRLWEVTGMNRRSGPGGLKLTLLSAFRGHSTAVIGHTQISEQHMLSVSRDGSVQIWNSTNAVSEGGAQISSVPLAHFLSFSDGQSFAAAATDGVVYSLVVEQRGKGFTLAKQGELRTGGRINALAAFPGNSDIVVVGMESGEVRVCNKLNGAVLNTIRGGKAAASFFIITCLREEPDVFLLALSSRGFAIADVDQTQFHALPIAGRAASCELRGLPAWQILGAAEGGGMLFATIDTTARPNAVLTWAIHSG